MGPTANDVAKSVGEEAISELADGFRKIQHCLAQLNEDQVWHRPNQSMNSIGNLLLHLGGNVRQWLIAGIGGVEDRRDRPREFAERGPTATEELLQGLESTLNEAQLALSGVTPSELLRVRRIQGSEVTGTQAIFESVAHFRGHAQEIVHITRCLIGDDYKYDFVPQTPEEGAPS
jgi:uncharacterized damage-inducible protein DinB